MIKRTFHPIGQGAFYSERHENFNIVYDCGDSKNTKLADNVVKHSFGSTESIDILFISHFDYDHISKIGTLKNNCKKIKTVILPLLHLDEIKLLTNFYNTQGRNDIVKLINNPSEYFGDSTKIIHVMSGNNNEPVNDDIPENIESLGNKINSGTKITVHGLDWIYIPFNYEYNQRRNELENFFLSNGLNIEKFKEDISYGLTYRKEIKNIYDKVTGKINQNSMMVYSGPVSHAHGYRKYSSCRTWHRCCDCRYCFNDCYTYNSACIFTGDADLNVSDIRIIFRNYWKSVGTIQIPHHGDFKSFNGKIFKHHHFCCPISFGTNNLYGHPSGKVFSELLSSCCFPIPVTEKRESIFEELIEEY